MQKQKITPFLWFDGQAEEAANFYVSVFKNSKIKDVFRQGDKALTVGFQLDGQHFTALNGGPMFTFNPSISIFTTCESVAEADAVWRKLVEGGQVMMPYDKYPWSEKYGWLQDRYGVSWQILVAHPANAGQKFSPCLMFTEAQHGRAEEAINFYTSLFNNSSIGGIARYEAGEGDPAVGTVKHAEFRLEGNLFMAMDSSMLHGFGFNEAFSLVINCEGQDEVDFFWNKLIADGGAESQCGWLKDKFGLSWQVVPTELLKLLSDPDPARAQRAMGAMMQMQKIEIEKLRQAANDDSKTIVTIETTVAAPIEKVWDCWTQPEHVVHWNHASDDWHSPHAENDLRTGGSFNYRMEAKDGSFGFDFGGTYDQVVENQRIEYTIGDGRKVQVSFSETDGGTHVMETFEAENMNSHEMQRGGWQAILDNFKKHVES
ncbi:MAG: VOC family protein [Bacteroidetes bacterium]|nr:VOC family protein [Bacteroidota bacterium]